MTFEHPRILLFVWSALFLILLALWGNARRRRIMREYATGTGYERLCGQASAGRRYGRAVLSAVAFLFMLVALAGPRYGYRWEEIERKGVDIVVALDCSKSMLAEDIAPNRLERAKREIIDLLNMLTGDRIGLVAFSGTAFLQCPLTQDYSGFHIFLDALSPDFLPVGGTDLSAALQTALTAFNADDASDKAVILITDGEGTTGENPVDTAKNLAKAGVKVFCVGVGDVEGAPVPGTETGFHKDSTGKIVISKLDEETLRQIALVTGGAYVRSVAGDMDLDVIYKDRIRGAMEAKTLQTGKRQVRENRFQWFVSLALACLFLEMLISVKKEAVVLLVLGTSLVGGNGIARAENVYTDVQQGRAAYDKGDYEKALTCFIDAQLKDPDNPVLYYNIGDAYYKTGNYEAALHSYTKALSLAEKDKNTASGAGPFPGFKKNALYNLGNTAFRQNDFDRAIGYYEKTLTLDPDDQQAKDNLAAAQKAKELQQQRQQQQKDQGSQDRQDEDKGNGKDQRKNDSGTNRNQTAESNQQAQPSAKDRADRQQPPVDRESGEKQTDGGNQQAQQEPRQSPTGPKGDLPEERQAEQQPAAGTQTVTPEDIREKKLNRLQDKPGAAMIPVYRGRKIEKDW
ncbi:MAG: VWA domain-containing protein [Thermodesulfobacteriota bacterium]|nr:VWA domain-containing protein [Thermodesulfobacteriota bacterium]